jgi:hypothetical protein
VTAGGGSEGVGLGSGAVGVGFSGRVDSPDLEGRLQPLTIRTKVSMDPTRRRREVCENDFGDSGFTKTPIKIIIVLIITSTIIFVMFGRY